MKNRHAKIYIILAAVLFLLLLQLTSCSLIEGAKGILDGFEFGQEGSPETISSTEIAPEDDIDNNITDDADKSEDVKADDDGETVADSESEGQESYKIAPADRKGMKSKVETEHYIFYFNDIGEEFLSTYIKIAEDGSEGIITIFGEVLEKKIDIFLCQEPEEFATASDGITPPGFDGSEPAGQSISGAVYMYKAEEFKPGPVDADDILRYKIALLHEIGHAYYYTLYPNAARKNNWLDEALADKSITGSNIEYCSISNDFLKEILSRGDFTPLSELESKGKRNFGRDENDIFSEYISFVNFICLEFGFDTLDLFLEEYNGSSDLLNSLETATKLDCSTFEQQWMDAIQNTAATGISN
jgi:hypothetical protein